MNAIKLTATALVVTWLAACSSTQPIPLRADPNADGTLVIRESAVLRIATGGSGRGTMTLRGWQYPFEVNDMVLSGIGPSQIQLEGDVYNIDNARQLEGTFNLVSAEIQSGQGAQGFWFENDKGVRVHIRANGQDVSVRLDGGASTVTLIR